MASGKRQAEPARGRSSLSEPAVDEGAPLGESLDPGRAPRARLRRLTWQCQRVRRLALTQARAAESHLPTGPRAARPGGGGAPARLRRHGADVHAVSGTVATPGR